MKRIANALVAGFVLTLIPGLAVDEEMSIGQREYQENCAVCHGVGGKGNGPYAELLKVALPDLTMLSANNGGVFSVETVYEIIDGRATVKAHGPRDMPVWGSNYNEEAFSASLSVDYVAPFDPESYVRGRILALISHLDSLQQR